MSLFSHSENLIVLDFETTGMSPEKGDRVIEIGAVLLRESQIVDRFQSLVNPGFLITREIESITGITNLMLSDAPPAAEVMERFIKFIGTYPLAAHNASFDQKFLVSELDLFGKTVLSTLPARFKSQDVSIRMSLITNWKPWSATRALKPQDNSIAPWPMRRWRQLCGSN